MSKNLFSLLLPVFLLVQNGCGVKKGILPAEPTQFLSGIELSGNAEGIPFQNSWAADDLKLDNYTSIYIVPVSTEFLSEGYWHESAGCFVYSRDAYRQQVNQIAIYLKEALEREFKESNDNRFKLTTEPGVETLILETSLTEVVFEKPVPYIASYALPVPGASQIFTGLVSPAVTFELRVRDSKSGKIVAAAIDRRISPIKIIDLNRFTVSGSVKEIIDSWVTVVVEAFNHYKQKKIIGPSWYKLSPW